MQPITSYIYYALSGLPALQTFHQGARQLHPSLPVPPTKSLCQSLRGSSTDSPSSLNSPSPNSLHLFDSLSPTAPHLLLTAICLHIFFISYESPGTTIFCQLYAISCLNLSSQIELFFLIDFFRGILGSPRLNFYFLKHVMSI